MYPHIHPATQAYFLAVVAAGGTFTTPQFLLTNKLIGDLWDAGAWASMDDGGLIVTENETQALMSLKQNRLGSAVAAPSFTANAGYAFNGSSQYLDTGFIPGTHAVVMSGSDMRLAVYERTNVASNTYAAGVNDSATSNAQNRPRSAGGAIVGLLNSSSFTISGVSNSRGLMVVSRTAAPVFECWRNGVSLGTNVPAGNATTLPTRSLYVGALNSVGTAASFRASTLGWWSIGASLTAAQELATYNALQSYMTAKGANV